MDNTDLTTGASQPDGNAGATTQTAGNGGFDFTAALSSEYSENPSIQKFNGDVNNMAKSYLALEQLMGQGRVVVPKDAADSVAWQNYDKAFGIPAETDSYNLKAKEGFALDNVSSFEKLMRDNHISPAAAQNILDAYADELIGQQQAAELASQNAAKTCTDALKAEWGLKYKQNIELANSTLSKFCADKDEYDHMLELIGNDTAAIKLLNKIGESISEGNLGGFEGQNHGFTKTPAEAKAEFDRILNDPNDAYWAGSRNRRNDITWCNQNHAQYVSEEERKARVRYVDSLLKMQG